MKHYYSLLSGGFDSTLATLKVIHDSRSLKLTPVFFNYGQKSKEQEEQSISQLLPIFSKYASERKVLLELDRHKVINIGNLFEWSQSSILEGNPDTEEYGLENRNMTFISITVSLILSEHKATSSKQRKTIITGFTNEYYDTKLKFVDGLNLLFDKMDLNIEVIAPLIPDKQRHQVSHKKLLYLAHAMDALNILRGNTWSCYFPQNGKPCDTCPPCKKRKSIFDEFEVKSSRHKLRH